MEKFMPHTMNTTQKIQAPGFFRFTLGKKLITVLSDGYFASNDLLTNISKDQVEALLVGDIRSSENYRVSINVFLVEEGDKKYLIDAGLGSFFDANAGHLHRNLKLAGNDPSEITAVLATHLHLDHIGGIFNSDGKRLFPNADLWVTRQEVDFWTNTEIQKNAPEGADSYFVMAQKALQTYEGRVRFIEENSEIAPGIKAIPLFGHTPGHVGYSIESEGQKLLIWGDLINAFVQIQRPDVGFLSDVNTQDATKKRKQIFGMAAESKMLISGMHLPFPGVGFIQKSGEGYRFVPLLWHGNL